MTNVVYTTKDKQASVLRTVDDKYVVHVSSDSYWGYFAYNVRGNLDMAKKKADRLGAKRAREVLRNI